MQNIQTFFDIKKKLLNFLEIILLCYLKLNTNQTWKKSQNIKS